MNSSRTRDSQEILDGAREKLALFLMGYLTNRSVRLQLVLRYSDADFETACTIFDQALGHVAVSDNDGLTYYFDLEKIIRNAPSLKLLAKMAEGIDIIPQKIIPSAVVINAAMTLFHEKLRSPDSWEHGSIREKRAPQLTRRG